MNRAQWQRISRGILALVLVIIALGQPFDPAASRIDPPRTAEATVNQAPEGNGLYSENTSTATDTLELSNNSGFTSYTYVYNTSQTVYIRVKSRRVNLSGNGTNTNTWTLYDHTGVAVSGTTGSFTQQAGGPPYVYTANFTMPTDNTKLYVLYLQIRDNASNRFQTYESLEISGATPYIRFFSDPARTTESYVFSRTSTGNHVIYARQYGTTSSSSTSQSTFQILNFPATAGTFTVPSVITRTGNFHDWQVDLMDSAISTYTTNQGWWYYIQPYLRTSTGTTVSRYQAKAIKVDSTGPNASGAAATPNPTNGASTVSLTANITDDGGQTTYNATPYNSYVTAAEWYTGTDPGVGKGYAMSPSDGVFASVTENVTTTINVSTWVSGTTTIYVRGQDSAGNWGTTTSTTVTVQQPDLLIDIIPASSNADPGAPITYTVQITNTGLVTDNITLGKSDSNSTYFSSTMDTSTIVNLARGSSVTRSLVVTPASNAPASASNTTTVTATPANGSGTPHAHTAVTTANQVYGATISAQPSSGSVVRGSPITYTLTVTNTGNGSDTIQLQSTDNQTGFNSSSSPSSVTLAANASANVTLWVTPTVSAAAGVTDQTTATTKPRNGASTGGSAVVSTTALSGYNVAIGISPPGGSTNPGASLSYSVRITNTGVATDTITLARSDSDSTNFTNSLDTSPVSNIPSGSSVVRTLVVTPTLSASAGIAGSTVVTATSGNGTDISASRSVTTTVNQAYSAAMSIQPTSGSAKPSSPFTYTLTITNTGNGTDTIVLQDQDTNTNFNSTLSATSVTLPKGASTTVNLLVSPTSNAWAGASDITTVTAKPNNGTLTDGSVQATTAALAGYGIGISTSPSSGKSMPGQPASYTVTVTNTGNVTDTINLSASDSDGTNFASSLSLVTFSSVSPGAAVTSTLTVTPTTSGGVGASDTTSVTARSAGDNTVSGATSVVTTGSAGDVTLSATDRVQPKVSQGQFNVLMMSATVSATTGTGVVSGIKVARTGASSDSDVAAVKVFLDNNGDGYLDASSETLLGSGQFTGAVADITFAIAQASSPPLKLLIAYDIAATAAVSDTVGVAISNANWIHTTANVSGTFPVTSSAATIYDKNFDFTPPTAPSNLTADPRGQNMAALGWNPATDNVGVVSYTLEISFAGNSFTRPIYPKGRSTWIDTGLSVGTFYQYRIQAFDAAGNASPYSNIANVTTTSTPFSPHASRTVLNSQAACNACHDLYGAGKQKPRVDLVCYTCHDGTGSSYNTRGEFSPSGDGNALTPGSTLTSYHEIYNPTLQTDKYNDVYCTRCHNPMGYVSGAGPNLSIRLLKNPFNRATNTEQFCYGCHNSTGDTNAYALGGQISSTFSAGAHKTGTSADPTGSGNNVVCLNCHGPHASNNDNLVGRTTYTNGPNGTKPLSLSAYSNQYAGSKLCLSSGCHDSTRISPNEGWNVYNQFMVSSTQHSVVTSTGGSSVGCSNCHGPHTVQSANGSTVSDPSNTINIAPYGTAGERTTFCKSCHDGSPPAFAMTSTTIQPQTITFPSNQTITTNNGGWDKTNYAAGVGHYDKGYGCDRCHSPHASSNPRLVTQPEDTSTVDGICLQCHNGTVTGAPNLKTPLTRTNRHPTLYTSTKHFDTETLQTLPLSQRHAECADCHDPHQAQPGTHTPGQDGVGNVLRGVSGVTVTNLGVFTKTGSVANQTPTYAALTSITEEYQLCLECHSSYSWGTTPPQSPSLSTLTATDLGREINVNNASYHWVENDKFATSSFTPRTSDTARKMTFVAPTWTKNSPMDCSDCHSSDQASDPKGPHGSNQKFILKGMWSSTTGSTNNITNHLCFNCHDKNTYGQGGTNNFQTATGFSNAAAQSSYYNFHLLHLTSFSSQVPGCMACHSAVPHGGWNRALLVQYDDPAPYNNGSQLGIATWATSGNWQNSNCGINSHTGSH